MKKTTDKILKAAAQLFSQHGYKDVSTKSIARRARVNEATLFRTFGGKRAILERVIEQMIAATGYGLGLQDTFQQPDFRRFVRAFAAAFYPSELGVRLWIGGRELRASPAGRRMLSTMRHTRKKMMSRIENAQAAGIARRDLDVAACGDLLRLALFGHAVASIYSRYPESPKLVSPKRLTEAVIAGMLQSSASARLHRK
jgi:AcrR family transcriptional regulator